jgi:hypothetical protein
LLKSPVLHSSTDEGSQAQVQRLPLLFYWGSNPLFSGAYSIGLFLWAICKMAQEIGWL